MRILVLSDLVPRPALNAGDRRFATMLELLARRHTVDFVIPVRGASKVEAEDEQLLRQAGVNFVGVGWSAMGKAFGSGVYHAVLCEFFPVFLNTIENVRRRQPGAIVIIDSVDVHFAREQAAAALGLAEGARAEETKQTELAVYRAADAVIVVTEDDARVLRAAGGVDRLFTIPIILPARARSTALALEPLVLFVGGFLHPPNIDAVVWFAKEVWPQVRSVVADALFYIVGSSPPEKIRALARDGEVVVTGQVPDIGPYLDRARVSVAPLRYGAGMKGKVVEALASGVPVVTTSVGAQGIPLRSGEDAMVADDPVAFTAAVITLLQDARLGQTIGRAGQAVAAAYSPQRIAIALEQMLQALVPGPGNLRHQSLWLGAQARVALQAVVRGFSGSR